METPQTRVSYRKLDIFDICDTNPKRYRKISFTSDIFWLNGNIRYLRYVFALISVIFDMCSLSYRCSYFKLKFSMLDSD